MNLSIKWLKDFCDCSDIDPKHYSDVMTATGSKVECFETKADDIENVLVGKVLSMERHPNSDHMWICQIDLGKETRQIVTGAQNVHVGDLVPAAVAPAKLPGGITIKAGKLRGEASDGMLCSIAELGLTQHEMPYAIEDGILILQPENEKCIIGADIRDALDLRDTVVEFEITSNRADCLSVIGLARESAASFDRPLTIPTPKVASSHDGDTVTNYLNVTIQNEELCPRYTARVVKNVCIQPSPLWMRMRLSAAGVRPINNIVDITNYVMLEYGQPMHAFDDACLDGNQIVVRTADQGEHFVTLDDQEHILNDHMLVIADGKKPVALAGVMGGANSEITQETKQVVFESACFDGASVRVTAKKLGMRTEASARFEKGLDRDATVAAVNRACELVQLLDAGDVVDGLIDLYPLKKQPVTLPLECDRINQFLGIHLTKAEMIAILEKIYFTVKNGMVTAPSFRLDIGCMADLAEEVIRMHGYNTIESTTYSAPMHKGGFTPVHAFRKKVGDVLCAMGLDEIMTFTFISPKYYDKMRMPKDDPRRHSIVISNPLGEDTSIMRTTTIPSMLEILALNHNRHDEDVAFFEMGKVYLPRPEGTVTNTRNLVGTLPDERNHISIGMFGKGDFYTMKGYIEGLLTEAGITDVAFLAESSDPTFHPGRCAKVLIDGETVGVFGEIHPFTAKNYGLDKRTYVAELDYETIWAKCHLEKEYRPLPKFPATTRDLAFVCDEELEVGKIEECMHMGGGKLLEDIHLFDIYRGTQVEEGKKSVAFNLSFRAPDRTLTDEETDKATKKILFLIEKNLGLSLRS